MKRLLLAQKSVCGRLDDVLGDAIDPYDANHVGLLGVTDAEVGYLTTDDFGLIDLP